MKEAIQNTQPESNVVNARDHIKNLHSSIVACFESISAEGSQMWSPDSVTDTSTLLLAIATTEFLSVLVITNGCLQYLGGLTISLQEEAKDIVQAVSEINCDIISQAKPERMLTPTTVDGLKQSMKCVGKWGSYHLCPEYVVISITEPTHQHLILLNILEEISQFPYWTTFLQNLTGSLVHTKKLHFKVFTWYQQYW